MEAWNKELASHPDRVLVETILQGIKVGFRVGFDPGRATLKEKDGNMASASEQTGVISKYLEDELEQGRVIRAGTSQEAQELGIHCNPFGVIPKKNQPGKFRLIVSLSAPDNHSVNDGINKELASLSYVTVDEVAKTVASLGRGAELAKMDIKQAYRNVPVHPHDRRLLGMKWQGQVYIDATLPFGLRSAPLIFSAVADAAMWIITRRGVSHVVHYIDDFLTIGGPDTKECAENNTVMHEVCEYLGLPTEPAKDEGPTTSLSFTGIEIDSEAMELRLPKDKLVRLLEELSHWRGRKACKKRDLLSLIGLLAHASKVVRAGRTFLRRLINLSMAVTQLEDFVRLNHEARSDIEWWYQFSSKWNGITMLQERSNNKMVSLTSDASGSWGCGSYWDTKWFMFKWSGPVAECHITTKELVPIVMATHYGERNGGGRQCKFGATMRP